MSEPRAYHGGHGAKVWIVDDSPLEAGFASRALQAFTVEVFSDGSSMLERLASGAAPEVLILDWHMPGLSGVEICEYLRSNEATSTLQILLLTVQSHTRDVVEGLRAGANDYVKKPYAPEELVARVESLLRSMQMRLRAEEAEAGVLLLLRHLPDALLMIDDQERVVFANETAKLAFDDAAQGVVGRAIREVLPKLLIPKDGHMTVGPDIAHGERIFSPVIGPVPQESVTRTAIALRDVTAERGIEARRLDFYSIVAHDLRTPLAAMMLRSEHLLRGRRGTLPEAAQNEVELIRNRLKQMAELVNDFLDIARVDAAGIGIEPALMNLSTVVVEAVDHLRSVADDATLSLHCHGCESEHAIVGDARRLRQVVTNLLSNAIKFTPAGGAIDVTIAATDDDIEVSVKDTGLGISPVALPILFQRYARVVDARSIAGTGLGLMIVREVIEAHRGKVGVESEPGQGSRFWFSVPRALPNH